MAQYPDRYVPADTNGGWPFAGFVVFLAVMCIVVVTIIHKKTYKHPTDPSWHGIEAASASAEHP